MRQAEGNPIIYLSQLASRGDHIPYGKYGDKCYVIPKDKVNDNMLLNADMILTPTNASRASINKYIREELRGIDSDLPVVGEKLICRKNNRNRIIGDGVYLVNGMLGYVVQSDKSSFNGTTLDIAFSPDFNENIFTTMYKNHIAGAVQICPIKCPGFAGNREQWLEDICIYSEATLYKNNSISPINNTGNVDKIIISKNETSLIHNDMRKGVFEHLRLLDKQLDDATEQYEIDNIRERRSRLAGNVVTIYVGATTELELKEKKDRIEDAVCALQTALKGGISEGGGMTFMRAYNTFENKKKSKGYNAVITSLAAPFVQLGINSDMVMTRPTRDGYNFKTNVWEDLKKAGVIDPTLVLKNAITNAIGIASNLLTTNCITYKES
jgi:chaperonin GroEL (HSP60 family)